MKSFIITFLVLFLGSLVRPAFAAPYEFTDKDYIEYGIYFSPRASEKVKRPKLLTIRFGDIEGWYKRFIPGYRGELSLKQQLNIATSRGSVSVNRNDNEGLRVARETYKPEGKGGTKRLEVTFQNGTCSQPGLGRGPCSVELLLTTDDADKGVNRSPRTLTITTSTGLSFRYRSIRYDVSKPFTRERRRQISRSPVINNYAWEWRYSEDK